MPTDFLFSSRPSTITTRSQPTRNKKKAPTRTNPSHQYPTLSRSGRGSMTWTHKKVFRYLANLTNTVMVSSTEGAPRNEGLQPYLFLLCEYVPTQHQPEYLLSKGNNFCCWDPAERAYIAVLCMTRECLLAVSPVRGNQP
ncbi:unnamed protein product [Ectocarpus sp. 12 AP-2014]